MRDLLPYNASAANIEVSMGQMQDTKADGGAWHKVRATLGLQKCTPANSQIFLRRRSANGCRDFGE